MVIATELSSGLPLPAAQIEIRNFQNQTIASTLRRQDKLWKEVHEDLLYGHIMAVHEISQEYLASLRDASAQNDRVAAK